MDTEFDFDAQEEPVLEPQDFDRPEFYAIYQNHLADNEFADSELDLIADTAISYIREILSFFGETSVSVDEYDGDNGELILDISGGNLAVLIGRHGRCLDALQTIVSSYLSDLLKFHFPISVDIEGYKNRRKDKVIGIGRSAAARAIKYKNVVKLPPMTPYERRLIHLDLQSNDKIETYSEGEDSYRHIVISYVG